jgi:multicomponent K+:H+ antiporter subunit A
MTLLLMTLLPFAGSLLTLNGPRAHGRSAQLAALAPALALALLLMQAPAVLDGAVLKAHWHWLPAIGLDLGLRLDGLGLLFALLILGIGLLIILYARYYLHGSDSAPKFYTQLLLFMGAMLGLVLADNLLLMLVFWELTSIASFLLVGYWSDDTRARKGARMALAVTGLGGLALLAGLLLLGWMVGSFELDAVLAAGDLVRAHPLYPLMLGLILLGAFTKSAQFPFQFWLPQAMSAPTPASAYLHSATMVKAGIFLLARLYPTLSTTELWFMLVAGTGVVTLLYGAWMALFQHDLKGLLAYSTISHLGLIVLLLGLDTELSTVAALFHIINHATFKASLFMAAGIIDHETGTRDMRRINGLWKYMPYTALLAMVASAAMAGVPLLNGFLSKEMFFAETLSMDHLGSWNWLLPAAATLAGALSVAYSLRFIHDVFFNGEPIDLPNYPPHEPPRYMKVPVEVLVVLCLLVGILPAFTVAPLLASAATAALGGDLPDYSLALWHGFNLPLAMSALALVAGVTLYALRRPLFALAERRPAADALLRFEALVQQAVRLATRLVQLLENGSLQRYLALLLGLTLAAIGQALWPLPRLQGELALQPVDGVMLTGAALMALCAFATVGWYRERLLSLLPLGAVGLITALIFARMSAPDLALTQLSVEFVTTVLLMLVLFFLPARGEVERNPLRLGRDWLLAALAGLTVGALAFAGMTRSNDPIGGYFIANAYSGGGGNNAVNVILVDFRGFDTLGEISVLAIAAIGIAALLRNLKLPVSRVDADGRPWARDRYPVILAVLSRLLLPLALLVSIYLFLRGHHLPGGGFIAGLVTACAMVLQYVASGARWTRRRLRLSYGRITASGLLVAIATGVGSWLFGYPFLTSAFGYLQIPVIGQVEWATALLFDLGVYLTVIGSTLLILYELGRMNQPSHDVKPLASEV